MVTRTEVARRAGVSVGTVSNVMNNKSFVRPELVRRVRQAIEELNYVPDSNAKSLARRRSNHIGIAVYEMTNPYHAEVIAGLEEYVAERGYMVTTFLLDNASYKKYDEICERRLDGLVNFMTNDLPRNFIEELKRQSTVLVNFNPDISFIIVNDYAEAQRRYMEILRDYGHKNVGYLCSCDSIRFHLDLRGKTFLEERERCGFNCDDTLIMNNENYSLRSEVIGYELCKKMLDIHPEVTALFATNDLVALGAMHRLNEMGLSCPRDVSVIGCDDIFLGEYFNPPLSTISFDKRKYGGDIGKMIIEKVENPEREYETQFVPMYVKMRESIAKARK